MCSPLGLTCCHVDAYYHIVFVDSHYIQHSPKPHPQSQNTAQHHCSHTAVSFLNCSTIASGKQAVLGRVGAAEAQHPLGPRSLDPRVVGRDHAGSMLVPGTRHGVAGRVERLLGVSGDAGLPDRLGQHGLVGPAPQWLLYPSRPSRRSRKLMITSSESSLNRCHLGAYERFVGVDVLPVDVVFSVAGVLGTPAHVHTL